ncbi:205_t:CDS:2 [Scutellospora calospora]|uniref:205_t:CDS:1 n=1 Tax=Scutellospora calospora TaxID=85575 RepID=A0ACA9K2X3_9GLOM|nr:205_t:CDS:2 [Scutellospora calospora]
MCCHCVTNANAKLLYFSLFEKDQFNFSKQIKTACESIGFFFLKNHGIESERIDYMFKNSQKFFGLSLEEKSKYAITRENKGYTAINQETLDPDNQKVGDFKESFNFGKIHNGKAVQELPLIFEENLIELESFIKSCHGLCMKILQAFAIALEINETEGGRYWFEKKHRYEETVDILRILHYPPIYQVGSEDIRAGSHSDYGSLTILFQKDIGGLEVLSTDMNWISVPVFPDCVLINIGDLLEFWSQGLFKSTKHRVVCRKETLNLDRYSIAYFCHAENDVRLDRIPSRFLVENGKGDNNMTAENRVIIVMPSATSSWSSNRNFGVVIDAGSSGSRIQIYSWKEHGFSRKDKDPKDLHILPTIERGDEFGVKWQKKVEPGISSFALNPTQVGEKHLKELIDFALEVVPSNEISNTPIYLLATAGMRLLPSQQQTAILQSACDYIMFQNRFKMMEKCSDHVQVISGEKEGLYGWIAVNYLMGGFEKDKGDHKVNNSQQLNQFHDSNYSITKHTTTFGFLDMGGASTQIAFEPNLEESKKHANDLTTVLLWTLDGQQMEYKVFVTTFLGYGTNEARRRYIEYRIQNYTSSHEKIANPDSSREQPNVLIKDPCLPVDLLLTDTTLPPPFYTLQGTGNFEHCLNYTYPLLNKSVTCYDEPCLFNGVHTPNIDFTVNNFIGISEYWYTSHDIFNLGGTWDYKKFETKSTDYCSNQWDNIVSKYHKDDRNLKSSDLPRLEMQCFKAAWLVNVLHNGIGIPKSIDSKSTMGDSPLFQSIDVIDNMQVSWTLGKMVLEASSTIPLTLDARPKPPPNPQHHGIFGYYNFMVEWIIGLSSLIILLILIWCICSRKNAPAIRRRLDSMSIYSRFISLIRWDAKDSGPDYGRLEGGQYSPSVGFYWKIVNSFSRSIKYIRWKFFQFNSPFRRVFSKKSANSSEDISLVRVVDNEETININSSPIIEPSNTVIGVQDIPVITPIIEKGSLIEQNQSYFSRLLEKKRLSGDSAIEGGPLDFTHAFSTPINLSLTGLQPRNSSMTNLGKSKERTVVNVSNIGVGQSGSNGGHINDINNGITVSNTPSCLLAYKSRSTTSLGWMDESNHISEGMVEYEATDSSGTITSSKQNLKLGSSISETEPAKWYSTSMLARSYSLPVTSTRQK